MIKKILCGMVVFSGLSLLLAGCNTVHGFGQDVQEGGQSLSHVATEVQDGSSTATQVRTVHRVRAHRVHRKVVRTTHTNQSMSSSSVSNSPAAPQPGADSQATNMDSSSEAPPVPAQAPGSSD